MAHKTRLLRHNIRRAIVAVEMAIGEIAAAAARNADFFADFGGMVEQRHAASALTDACGTHHSRRACADDDGVESVDGGHKCFQTACGKPYCTRLARKTLSHQSNKGFTYSNRSQLYETLWRQW